jgi:hypothetical protein
VFEDGPIFEWDRALMRERQAQQTEIGDPLCPHAFREDWLQVLSRL